MFNNTLRQSAFVSLGFLLLTLSGCQSTSFASLTSVETLSEQIKNADGIDDIKAIAKQAKTSRDLIRADLKVIKALYAELDQKVNKKWGKDNG